MVPLNAHVGIGASKRANYVLYICFTVALGYTNNQLPFTSGISSPAATGTVSVL